MHSQVMKLMAAAAILLSCLSKSPEATISVRLTGAYNSFSSNSYLNPDNFLNLKSRFIPSTGVTADGEKENPFPGASLLKFSDYAEIDSLRSPVVKNRINELYLTFPFRQTAFLDIGKIVDRNGVAFFMNPTDFLILRRPDLNAESKESAERFYEGLTMARIQMLLPLLTIEAGYAPRITWNENRRQFGRYLFSMQKTGLVYCKTGGTLKGIDLKGIVVYDSSLVAGFNSSKAVGERLELHAEVAFKRKYNRWGLTKVQFGPPDSHTLSYDSCFSTPGYWSASVVTGGHCSFSNGFNLMLEYFFNGEGLFPADLLAFRGSLTEARKAYDSFQFRNLSLRSLQSYDELIEHCGIPGLSRHYLMVRLFTPIGQYLSLEGINAQSLTDFSGSIIVRPSISIKRLAFSLSTMVPYGAKDREFGYSLSDWTLGVIGEIKF
jgi:hypothetical protein